MYLKVGNEYGSFYDPKTKVVIRRGQIVEVKEVTELINKRIRAKGLIKCTEEEYQKQESLKKIQETPVLAGTQEVPVKVEPATVPVPFVPEIKKEEVVAPKEEPKTSEAEQISQDDSPLKKKQTKKL